MSSKDNTNRPAGRASARVQERDTAKPSAQAPRAERRPEMIRQRREQRTAAYEREQRNWMLTKIGLIAFGVVVVAVIGWLVYRAIEDRRLAVIPEGVANYSYTGGNHTTEPVEYAESPPVGGMHHPAWQNCGFYSAPIASENGVHSLEHGAVWITYQPDLPADQVEALRQLADQPNVLVSPYEGLSSPVVASSWNHQLQLDSATDERLEQFIRSFVKGPDTPELNGQCIGGVGIPE